MGLVACLGSYWSAIGFETPALLASSQSHTPLGLPAKDRRRLLLTTRIVMGRRALHGEGLFTVYPSLAIVGNVRPLLAGSRRPRTIPWASLGGKTVTPRCMLGVGFDWPVAIVIGANRV